MRQRVLTLGKSLVLALFLVVLTGTAQDFQIRTRVDLVVVPVAVKGSGNQLVTNLTKNDFTLFEDGKQQTITNFTSDPIPLSAAVVFDTGLTAEGFSKVQQTFPALASAFSEYDEVALYRFDRSVMKMIDFSKDPAAVETAMDTLRQVKPEDYPNPVPPGGPFSIPSPAVNGAPVVPPGQIGVMNTSPAKPLKVLHDAIFNATSDLAKRARDRRKIVLVISDGGSSGSERTYDEALRGLLDSGIQVYAVGLDLNVISRKLTVLNDYAKATGGDIYFANSLQSLEQAYGRAAEQARNQYVLGYVSNHTASGTQPVFRNFKVKLTAKGNFETVHRTGYYQYP